MQSGENMGHMTFLEEVARADVTALVQKEATYHGSWKRRGGVGAFMMLARKWDRIESMLSRGSEKSDVVDGVTIPSYNYDIFLAIEQQKPLGDEDGTALAEIRDLRRYLILVEAEMISRGVVKIERRRVPRDPPTPARSASRPVWTGGSECVAPADIEKIPANSVIHLRDPRDGVSHILVDRQYWSVPRADRFAYELNDKEHELTAPHFRGLYAWNESENKWILHSEFRVEWGR